MIRRRASLVAAAVALFASLAIAPPAQAAVTSNSTCHSGATMAVWSRTRAYVYIMNGRTTSTPAWCANANGSRLVAEQGGNLTLWDRAVSGGRLVWQSGTANHGATGISFQGDGNITIRNKYGDVLWQPRPSVYPDTHYCSTAHYWAQTFNNRWEEWVTGGGCKGTLFGDAHEIYGPGR